MVNANANLLRLPQEIKYLIYESVLGSQLIHIRRDPKKSGYSFTHYSCQAKYSEKEAEKIFAASKEPWYSTDIQSRHEACYPRFLSETCYQCHEPNDIASESYARLSLAFLRCCRQMYEEARSTIFAKSTFSFTDSAHLLLFSGPRSHIESAIRSLHLDFIVSNFSEEQLCNLAFASIFRDIESLQHIYINLELRRGRDRYLTKWRFKQPEECSALSHLRTLRHLKLKTVTVIISDCHILHKGFTGRQGEAERWTMLQKQEWAGYTKRVLLNQEEQ